MPPTVVTISDFHQGGIRFALMRRTSSNLNLRSLAEKLHHVSSSSASALSTKIGFAKGEAIIILGSKASVREQPITMRHVLPIAFALT